MWREDEKAAFPNEYGNYSTIGSCSVLYNGELCSTCESCTPQPSDPNYNYTKDNVNDTTIHINCCNVQIDKIQTCAPISANGATIQQFDYVPIGEEGQCTSGAAAGGSSNKDRRTKKSWYFLIMMTTTLYYIISLQLW